MKRKLASEQTYEGDGRDECCEIVVLAWTGTDFGHQCHPSR